jgi:hypothetical protein
MHKHIYIYKFMWMLAELVMGFNKKWFPRPPPSHGPKKKEAIALATYGSQALPLAAFLYTHPPIHPSTHPPTHPQRNTSTLYRYLIKGTRLGSIRGVGLGLLD